MSKRRRRRQPKLEGNSFGKCDVCDTPLGIQGGMGGTGLCGPCCTGESETLGEKFETW